MVKKLIAGLLFSGILATSILVAADIKIYCGSTMVKAMKEIAAKIEAKEGVSIEIVKGGSAKLYKKLSSEKNGDLYLPGSDSYIKKNKKDGYLGFGKYIGYNQAVIITQEGNPKGIKTLDDFAKPTIKTALGAPKSGSIGKIAKAVLIKYKDKDFYNLIAKKSLLASNSTEIIKALESKKIDAALSWKASAAGTNFTIVKIPDNISPRKKLKLTLLTFSKNKKIAKEIIQYAASKEGKAIMKKHGF